MRRELESLIGNMHASGLGYEDAVREFKRQYLKTVLTAHRGNQCKAAEELKMHRNTLNRTMSDLGLEPAQIRQSARQSAREDAKIAAGLKRPPQSVRPVYDDVAMLSRHGLRRA